jgi:large subunit ribosomal protein L10
MPKPEKIEKVADLKERITSSQALLLADFRGLTVHDAGAVRALLRESGTSFKVVKNTLMKRAADEAGMEELSTLLEGPTGVAFVADDPVVAAKKIVEAAKQFPALVLKGGYMEGRLLSPEDAKALAELDSREVMLSKIAGMLQSEMSRAARDFASHQSRFVSLLEAFKDKLPADEVAEVAEAISDAVEAVEELVAAELTQELVAEGAEPEAAAEVAEAVAEDIAEAVVAEAIVEAIVEEAAEEAVEEAVAEAVEEEAVEEAVEEAAAEEAEAEASDEGKE